MKIRPLEAELFHVDEQRRMVGGHFDRQTEAHSER
jgi:hypothetical protein